MIFLCLTLLVVCVIGVRALIDTNGAGTTTRIKATPTTSEPETPSVMYKHTVTLYYHSSESNEHTYTFEVLSTSDTAFNSLSDIPDGSYPISQYFALVISHGSVYFEDDMANPLRISQISDVVTIYEPGDSEIVEPEETSSPAMYTHSISLSQGGGDSPLVVYAFEVTSSIGSEFNSLSDVPDGIYSCTCNGNPISNFKIDQGLPFVLNIDDEWSGFTFETFSDFVTHA